MLAVAPSEHGGRGAPGSVPRRKPRLPAGAGNPSVVRHAITIVLNHPQAALELDAGLLDGVSRAGTDLLQSLVETVQSEPTITTAGLLERWRHDEQGRHLGKLAAAEMPLDEDFDAAAELAECLGQLALAGRKERIDFLIEKQKLTGLSGDEKSELRQLV
jgi:DNA primase